MKTPQWVKDLSDDLLLHSYWDNAPPVAKPWIGRAVERLRAFRETPPWATWTQTDYMYAAMYVSVGIGLVAELVRIYKMVNDGDRP